MGGAAFGTVAFGQYAVGESTPPVPPANPPDGGGDPRDYANKELYAAAIAQAIEFQRRGLRREDTTRRTGGGW
jgi:hypothetical protein